MKLEMTDTAPNPKRRRWRWLAIGLVVVGILFVGLIANPPRSSQVYGYLSRSPNACAVARVFFRLIGKEDALDDGLLRASLTQAVLDTMSDLDQQLRRKAGSPEGPTQP
jgi:hypothetical protein